MRYQFRVKATFACIAASALGATATNDAQRPAVDPDGTIHVPAYTLPESSLLGSDARDVLNTERMHQEERASAPKTCPSAKEADAAHMPVIRKCEAEAFYETPAYKHLRALYRVSMTPKEIGRVYTEIFEPAEGIAPRNAKRVLINIHGPC